MKSLKLIWGSDTRNIFVLSLITAAFIACDFDRLLTIFPLEMRWIPKVMLCVCGVASAFLAFVIWLKAFLQVGNESSNEEAPTIISEREDEINKHLIANGSFSFLQRGHLSSEQVRLMDSATPQERQVYVKKRSKRFMFLVLCVGAYFVWLSFQPAKPVPPPPAIEVTDAGTIKEIQLHETTFSTASTVITTAGVYQVRGGVSASAGDAARTEAKEIVPNQVIERSLCIKSVIKSACYRLM